MVLCVVILVICGVLRYIQMRSREEVHRAAGQETLSTGLCACVQPWWHIQWGNTKNQDTNVLNVMQSTGLVRATVEKSNSSSVSIRCFYHRFSATATQDTAGALPLMADPSVVQQWPIKNLDAKVGKTPAPDLILKMDTLLRTVLQFRKDILFCNKPDVWHLKWLHLNSVSVILWSNNDESNSTQQSMAFHVCGRCNLRSCGKVVSHWTDGHSVWWPPEDWALLKA